MAADPAAVGAVLLRAREMRPEWPLHQVADHLEWGRMPRYNASDSIATETHRRYHAELQERAAAGDRYATSLLLGQNPNDGAEAE